MPRLRTFQPMILPFGLWLMAFWWVTLTFTRCWNCPQVDSISQALNWLPIYWPLSLHRAQPKFNKLTKKEKPLFRRGFRLCCLIIQVPKIMLYCYLIKKSVTIFPNKGLTVICPRTYFKYSWRFHGLRNVPSKTLIG